MTVLIGWLLIVYAVIIFVGVNVGVDCGFANSIKFIVVGIILATMISVGGYLMTKGL